LKKEGITPVKLDDTFDIYTNIPNWKLNPINKNYISDVTFFSLLGVKLYTMDISDYQDCDIVHDLNTKIQSDLKERFDVVIDGGTMEHLFDTKQCLENICEMTKTYGRVIHMSPSNNYSGHGFYQFSPDIFFDYYYTNNFDEINGLYVITPLNTILTKVFGKTKLGSWPIYKLDNNFYGKMFISKFPSMVFFSAIKTQLSTCNKIPQQGDMYRSILEEKTKKNDFFISKDTKTFKIIKLVAFTWPFSIMLAMIIKYKKYIVYKKPWGLKSLGRF
jgi:hypothetical protein